MAREDLYGDTLSDESESVEAKLRELDEQIKDLKELLNDSQSSRQPSTETQSSDSQSKRQPFTETQLLDALRTAKPGESLMFEGVKTDQMIAAVNKLSASANVRAQKQRGPTVARLDFDLGPHITSRGYWWGNKVELDHEAMQALQAGGAAVIALLVSVGVTAMVAAIIAGVIGIWSAFDRGNGVIFYVTWTGVHWCAPR